MALSRGALARARTITAPRAVEVVPDRKPSAIAAPQLTPRRQAVVPGNAPQLVVRPSEVLPPQLAVTPQEPDMSLLGRIGGAVKGAAIGFVTGGPTGAITGGAAGLTSSRASSQIPSRTRGAAPGVGLVAQERGCPEGTFRGPLGSCIDLIPGGSTRGGGMVITRGEVIQGQYGAGQLPSRTSREYRQCPKGLVLANDGVCYPNVPRNRRMWDPGRKPLLTGGDLNAIARAERAATRLKVQQKRLERLGLLKKPKARVARSPGVITKAEAARALRS